MSVGTRAPATPAPRIREVRDRHRERGFVVGRSITLVAGCVAVVTAVAVQTAAETTAYAGRSTLAATAQAAAGTALVLSAVAASARGVRTRAAVVTLWLAIAWSAPPVVGWQDGPALARSLALVVAPFLVACLVHLAVLDPGDRTGAVADRTLVAASYLVVGVYSGLRALFRDPFLERDCWDNCTVNVFVVHPVPALAGLLDRWWPWVVLTLAVVTSARVGVRWVRASAVRRRVEGLAVAATATLAVLGVHAGYVLGGPELPDHSPFAALFVLTGAALVAVAAALARTVVADAVARLRLDRLARDLARAPEPGSLRDVLARTVGDSGLTVHYRVDGPVPFVDSMGHPVPPVEGPGKATTVIAAHGAELARVIHDSAIPHDALVAGLGPAATLGVENERLHAELRARLVELRASRVRLVETSDLARRRLERDLHDGAQQALVAVLLYLRMARESAHDEGDEALAGELGDLVAQAQLAVDRVRVIAHGIFPSVLERAGLREAVAELADDAGLRVALDVQLPADATGPGSAVERTVYLLVRAAVASAAAVGGRLLWATVRTDQRSGAPATLLVDVRGAPHTDVGPLLDRVLAAGGEVAPTPDGLRAVLPCA